MHMQNQVINAIKIPISKIHPNQLITKDNFFSEKNYLMYWWVHRIGANRAFKQLMNTGGRGDRRGTHNTIDAISVCCIIVVDGIIVRL